MAGKSLRRLSLLALSPLLFVLSATPADAAPAAPSPTGAATELLSPAIALDKTTGPFTVAEALGDRITTAAELPRTGASDPGGVPAIGTGLLIAGLVSVRVARWRRRTA